MRRILIIEDDAETAAYLQRGLEESGFAVDGAENGRDGLFLATEGGVDLIILPSTSLQRLAMRMKFLFDSSTL